MVALADPTPIERPVHEIGAEDDADVVELETVRSRRSLLFESLGSLAERSDFAMPGARRPTPSRAFQGIDQSPTLTSCSSVVD